MEIDVIRYIVLLLNWTELLPSEIKANTQAVVWSNQKSIYVHINEQRVDWNSR